MLNKGIMKTAVIYFEGKEVCIIHFCPEKSVGLLFSDEYGNMVAMFPDTYGYAIIEQDEQKLIIPMSTQDIINAQESVRNVAKGFI